MERCIFCGWNRRNAFPSVRFFMIPREPGMKQLMWMHAIDKKSRSESSKLEMGPRDRVCSVHFRSGRPSNDPSHEDFSPHLYLTSEPPAEVLSYLEGLAEAKSVASTPVTMGDSSSRTEYKAHVNPTHPNRIEVNKISRPSILQRKRKILTPPPPPVAEQEEEQNPLDEVEQPQRDSMANFPSSSAPDMFAASHPDHRLAPNAQSRNDPGVGRKVKLQMLSRATVEALGARPGQQVIIKRRVIKKMGHM
ncbi:hypothetical protein PFISCL1PPCAC_17 [Pristionchus fissidentatus]|uniref:THAP-type domain-containing protein n=1 Tax=Pristionchus fissidentatus TaxID=1538716 RepID=A0AAV5UNL7_9BILA|nr:hypothetical protein PFISCL1PPCAC_17 [Pristionchus fissidentatus]